MDLEQHLHMYRQMAKIRAFEEQVNELYKGAKMPGLAHLYVGEEAVAVGVCEALKRDDYITSTHRGHGHCLAKGASVSRMFAELLGKEPATAAARAAPCTSRIPETGNLGANAIVGRLRGPRHRRRALGQDAQEAARSRCASSATARSGRACSTRP